MTRAIACVVAVLLVGGEASGEVGAGLDNEAVLRRLADLHKLTVQFDPPNLANVRGQRLAAAEEAQALEQLESWARVYPTGFLGRYVSEVFVLNDLVVDGIKARGHRSDRRVFLQFRGAGSTFSKADFDHEVCHALDGHLRQAKLAAPWQSEQSRVLRLRDLWDDYWLMPSSRYTFSWDNVGGRKPWIAYVPVIGFFWWFGRDHVPQGFATRFGVVAPREDRATVAEVLFSGNHEFLRRAAADQQLREKVAIVKAMYRVGSEGRIDDAFWQHLYDGPVQVPSIAELEARWWPADKSGWTDVPSAPVDTPEEPPIVTTAQVRGQERVVEADLDDVATVGRPAATPMATPARSAEVALAGPPVVAVVEPPTPTAIARGADGSREPESLNRRETSESIDERPPDETLVKTTVVPAPPATSLPRRAVTPVVDAERAVPPTASTPTVATPTPRDAPPVASTPRPSPTPSPPPTRTPDVKVASRTPAPVPTRIQASVPAAATSPVPAEALPRSKPQARVPPEEPPKPTPAIVARAAAPPKPAIAAPSTVAAASAEREEGLSPAAMYAKGAAAIDEQRYDAAAQTFHKMLQGVDPGFATIQIAINCDFGNVLKNRNDLTSGASFYLLSHRFKGRGCFLSLTGLYRSRDEAAIAVERLPPAIREQHPAVRRVGDLLAAAHDAP